MPSRKRSEPIAMDLRFFNAIHFSRDKAVRTDVPEWGMELEDTFMNIILQYIEQCT